MIEIARILCPIDFSDASRHALEHAAAIARWYEAEVVGLHVAHVPIFPQPPILFAESTHGQPPAVDYVARERDLRAWLEPLDQNGIATKVVVEAGHPAQRILEWARAEPPSLIVMGTHGLSGFERFMIGSVAEKVVRKAACPVLTVAAAATTAANVPYRRLLCAMDFSDASCAAARWAFSLAKEADARLTLLHALDWPADYELLVEQLETPELRQLVETRARARLEAMIGDDVRTWCNPTTAVGYGRPYRAILDTAKDEAADLIVIGTHGRHPIDAWFFGSTANHVVRSAPCPVLTVKP